VSDTGSSEPLVMFYSTVKPAYNSHPELAATCCKWPV